MLTDPVSHVFLLALVVYISLRLEERFALFRSLGAALVGILLGMVLSNSGILPGDSPAYNFLGSTGVSAGVVLILLSVDLKSIRQAGPRMLAAFGLGALGSATGATLASVLLFRQVGPETWKLAGQYTGTYVGGGMNFAALARAFDTSSNLFTAAVAADVILTAIWMAVCLLVPVLLGRKKQVTAAEVESAEDRTEKPMTLEKALYESGRSMTLAGTAALTAIAIGALWLSEVLASLFPILPQVLWLTTLALLAAQIRPLRMLPGSAMLGNFFLLLFLAGNGAQSVVANIVRVGPAIFYFACITVAVHGLVIFGLGRLVKIDFGTLAVASQACVGGAASAAAMASARSYMDRLLPGVAIGLFGYAVGNYLGFTIGTLIRGWLGM
jgi:uncharacterized membrane protein